MFFIATNDICKRAYHYIDENLPGSVVVFKKIHKAQDALTYVQINSYEKLVMLSLMSGSYDESEAGQTETAGRDGQARWRAEGRWDRLAGEEDILLARTITLMLVFPSLRVVVAKQKQILIFQKQINTYLPP